MLVIVIAGGLLASPVQTGVAGADPAATAGRASLPAGVTSRWLAEVRDSLQQASTEQKKRPILVERALSFPNWSAESNQAGALFGISVAGAGDVNGDGYDDVIVGADHYDNGQDAEGVAAAKYGRPD